jgi:hypothetical protein
MSGCAGDAHSFHTVLASPNNVYSAQQPAPDNGNSQHVAAHVIGSAGKGQDDFDYYPVGWFTSVVQCRQQMKAPQEVKQ